MRHLQFVATPIAISTFLSCSACRAPAAPWNPRTDRELGTPPRLSLEERYPTHDDYVAKVTAAANELVKQRLLLPEDRDSIIAAANAAAVP